MIWKAPFPPVRGGRSVLSDKLHLQFSNPEALEKIA